MDSSNRQKLTLTQWFEVAKVAIEIYRPILKYLPAFRPLSEELISSKSSSKDGFVVEFSEGVDKKTKCMELFGVYTSSDRGYSVYKSLLLTDAGKFVRCEQTTSTSYPVPEENKVTDTSGTSSTHLKFRLLSDDAVLIVFSKDNAQTVAERMIRAGREHAVKLRKRLKVTERAIKELDRVVKKVASAH